MTAARVWRTELSPAGRLVGHDEDAVGDGRQPGELSYGEQAEHARLVELPRPSRRQPVLGALCVLTLSLALWVTIFVFAYRLFV